MRSETGWPLMSLLADARAPTGQARGFGAQGLFSPSDALYFSRQFDYAWVIWRQSLSCSIKLVLAFQSAKWSLWSQLRIHCFHWYYCSKFAHFQQPLILIEMERLYFFFSSLGFNCVFLLMYYQLLVSKWVWLENKVTAFLGGKLQRWGPDVSTTED